MSGPQEIDMLGWLTRFAMELIGKGGLGYSFASFNENTSNEFSDAVKSLLYVFAPLPNPLVIRTTD